MAETLISSVGGLTNNSKILVNVDHALENVLVVSYAFQSRLFQGVLLDSTNRYLPCASPSEFLVNKGKEILSTKATLTSPAKAKNQIHNANRSAPKVLITDPDAVNDKSNQENEPKLECPDTDVPFYGLSRRFTYFQDVLVQRQIVAQKTHRLAKNKSQKMTVRLRPRQVLCSKCKSICNENSEKVLSTGGGTGTAPPAEEEVQEENVNGERAPPVMQSPRSWLQPKQQVFDKRMVLRKKRSVGSMEDLWDETVFEEAAKKARTTPIIKISFGSPGEGTVLKIPAKVQTEEEEEEAPDVVATKAFKKALKKARKEARRKCSPEREDGSDERRHRHRAKHKRRRRSGSEESEGSVPEFPAGSPLGPGDAAATQDGSVRVGDVVWGKLHGFPWWPGKVESLSLRGEGDWDAKVSWFGSATSSTMSCNHLSPFLQTFKSRFNRKKKSSGYKEAIRQATCEAAQFDDGVSMVAEINQLLSQSS